MAQLRAMEKKHASEPLMQRAGEAVARLARTLLAENKAPRILLLAGPGNNGGDAWVAAHTLAKAKRKVTVLAIGKQTCTDSAAQKAQQALRKIPGCIVKKWPAKDKFNLIIDGVFGIGLSRAPQTPQGEFADLIRHVNRHRLTHDTQVLAIDLPSGLCADTGVAFDRDTTIHADHTLTFLGHKPGLYTADGPDYCGRIHLDTLGVPLPETKGNLLTTLIVQALIPKRRANSHKGHYGHVAIVGGAKNMVGAAVLAARAALHMGPGKVYLGVLAEAALDFDPLHPEIMVHDATLLADKIDIDACAVGMGAGKDNKFLQLLEQLLQRPLPVVIDADALHALASKPALGAAFRAYAAKMPVDKGPQAILTPHPGEAATLLGCTVADIQRDRIRAATTLAATWQAIVVLKGAGTVIAAPDGAYFINTTGNSGMASGGMGDALSGMLAALLAQGMHAIDAARLGVYLHGAAADACQHHGMAPHGLTASEVIFEARALLNSGLADEYEG